MASQILQLCASGCTWAAAARSRSRSATSTESSSFISPWRSRISSRCRSARIESLSRISWVPAANSNSATSTESSSSSGSGILVPWLMLPPSSDPDGMLNNFYDLQNNKVLSLRGKIVVGSDTWVVGSSHGWLALFKEYPYELFLWNPLTHKRLNLPLPPLFGSKGIGLPGRIILSCSPDVGSCRAAMSYCPEGRLAVCCPGQSTEWTPIGEWYHPEEWNPGYYGGKRRKVARRYQDFAFSAIHNRLFCITKRGIFERWDIGGDGEVNKMEWSHDFSSDFDSSYHEFDSSYDDEEVEIEAYKYVVVSEHSGEVFLVVRYIKIESRINVDFCKTDYFDVFKVEGHDLICKEETLDGLSIFIGINHSFAINTFDFPELELKPDSIYFTHQRDLTGAVCLEYGGHDLGIFSYQDCKFSTCYYASHVRKLQPPPLWFIHNH